MLFNEDTFEQAIIELFENMDYTHIYAPDMNRTDYSRPLLDDVLRDCLVRLNRSLPAVAIDEAILKLNDFDAGSLLQKNIVFMDYLQNGITVKYAVKGEERSSVVKLIDCNGVQREHNKKLNNGLPILHKVPPKRDYGRYFCIMAEKGGTSHGGLTEKLSLFFHAKKQEVNAYGR